MHTTIGFIGLGMMGTGIASSLLAKGYALKVYNRTASKAKALVEKGAMLASSPAKVATAGGTILSMVADDRALEEVANDELIAALAPGGLHISLSTVSPGASKKLAQMHAAKGVAFLSSPVFGRPDAAASAKLVVCVSGPAEAQERARPIFEAIGQKTFDFGPEIGAANVVKLAGNFMLTAAVEAMAEASALAEKNGVPRAALLNMLTSTLFNCPIYKGYGQHIIDADFDKVAFAIPLILKDMHLAQQTAASSRAPMPMVNLLCDRYLTLIATGREKLDSAALALGAAENAGLKW